MLPYNHSGTHRKTCYHKCNHLHKRASRPDRRYPGRIPELPHHEQIDGPVGRLENQGTQHRKCEPYQGTADGPFRK